MFDEWANEKYDEWDEFSVPSSDTDPHDIGGGVPEIATPAGKYPEVEIDSSSDEDAPPVPQSSQLARENLELRRRVDNLVSRSKNLEDANDKLKSQLTKCRTNFAHQMRQSFRKLFK